jgi:2-polyprenyl-3-methyl-5-hydroxy-6-metoxy-1,4-benzoquinol methylase
MKIPLNQSYNEKKTFDDYPEIKNTYNQLCKFSMDNNFYRKDSTGFISPKGRLYDASVIFNSNVDFNGKKICELGARDGIFGSWLTQFADEVHVSDYFEEWGKGTSNDLGSFEYWDNIWKKSAINIDKLKTCVQDITKMSYPDNYFDITICTSVIEHIFPQCGFMGDMIAMREISRITKPGGIIFISTDITKNYSKWHSGTFYYSRDDIYDRLINPSKCSLRGEIYFDFDSCEHDFIHDVGDCTSFVFSLEKPGKSI